MELASCQNHKWPYIGICKDLVDVDPEECQDILHHTTSYNITLNAFALVIAFMLTNALYIWDFLDDETDDHMIRKKQRKIKNILKAWLILALIHGLVETAFNLWPMGLRYTSNFHRYVIVFMAYAGFRIHGWIVVYLLYQKHENRCRDHGLTNGDNPENATDTSWV